MKTSIIFTMDIGDDVLFNNAIVSLNYVMRHYENKVVYVVESGVKPKFTEMNVANKHEIIYKTCKSEDVLKTVNSLMTLVDTKVCYMMDINVMLPVENYARCNALIYGDTLNLVVPYGKDKGIGVSPGELFQMLNQILMVKEGYCISSCGATRSYNIVNDRYYAMCFNTDEYKRIVDSTTINVANTFLKAENNVGFLRDSAVYVLFGTGTFPGSSMMKSSGEKDDEVLVKQEVQPEDVQPVVQDKVQPQVLQPIPKLTPVSSPNPQSVPKPLHLCDSFEEDTERCFEEDTERCFEEDTKRCFEEDTSRCFEEDTECDEMENSDDFSQIVYESHLYKIPEPKGIDKIFKKPSGNRLGICLIEFRKFEWLRYVLYQIARIYGGTDVSLYIVHGKRNRNFMRTILRGWENVEYIEYPYDNIDRVKYAEICCDPGLYERFETEFVLKMEWDSFIRKPIPEEFFEYEYVGAPWDGFPNAIEGGNRVVRIGNKLVGNGGFSLRNVKRMIDLCKHNPKPIDLGEDIHISNCLSTEEIPDAKKAMEFSVEHVYYEDPVGLHHVWTLHGMDKVMKWLEPTNNDKQEEETLE